ncbi:response regulator transcription factor [Xylanimonas protaetiae]|uniref:Response regulator transcription factor n=1 Tax=Xylanimonas protaetiae TaxID=2509457 RepID=A0A4P6FFV2_9MICO|nr:response regulator transcription factor [Xylanimonas protaetiae]QAY69478.1 response regulator transcription factor [Xylanimonas protaetiae]
MSGTDEPSGAIRVVLVDDHRLLRESLAAVIDSDAQMSVVGQAADGVEALDVVAATVPDVVLMDVRMPRLDGLEATRRICADPRLAHTRVIVLSMFALDEYVHRALRNGASGFLLKDARPPELIDAIRRTHHAESLFAPRILARLVETYLDAPAGRPPSRGLERYVLTPRETEVLALVGAGRTNDEIAADLHLAVKTVKHHIAHLLSKTGARDRAQLVITAYDTGLVQPRLATNDP